MKNLKRLHVKILIVAAIIGIALGITLKGIQIHNALTQASGTTTPTTAPIPQKTVYTFTLSHEVIVDRKRK